jgi:two-component system NarL family sensor kinase
VPLKYKVLTLAVLPLLVALGVVATRVRYHSAQLADEQATLIGAQLLSAKRSELQNYVGVVLSALTPLYGRGGEEQARKAEAKAILGSMHYGDEGYFFVYDERGICLVHPTMPELVGRDLRAIVDPRGRHVIPDLIETAQRGGGFQTYAWQKPPTGKLTEKMAYVALLPKWGWVVGTGVYVDDVEQTARQVRERSTRSVVRTLRTLGFVALLAVVLVFACGMALNTSQRRLADGKLKAMAQRIVHLQEEERAHVSRHLHDGVSQTLVAAKFHFESAQRRWPAALAEPAQDLKIGLRELNDAIVAVRDMSHEMRPLELDELGLADAIRQFTRDFMRRSSLRVTFQDDSAAVLLSDEAAVALFRIAQEALSNVERHAAAERVEVELSRRGSGVCLSIRDDGRGFDVARITRGPSSGIGLRNVRERCEHLEGTFEIRSEPGRTELVACLPATGTKP